MKDLCVLIAVTYLARSVCGLDPQPTANVWQTANNTRPWHNPAWATPGSQPASNTGTPQIPQGNSDWPSLPGAKQPSQQPSPTVSYSSIVSPTNQRTQNGATSPSPQRFNPNGQQTPQRNTYKQPRPTSQASFPQNRTKTTDQELSELSEKLFNDDVSNTGRNIKISIQSRTQSNSLVDEAPQSLLSVDNEALQKPTIKALRQLYDNYIADPSFVESVTAIERQEESEFLDKVLDTTVMKEAMEFLAGKGFVQKNKKAYKDLLSLLWFTMYSRGGGIIGSSAFEHVFMGELKRDEVGGLHNWIFFANEEENHRVDYMGYLKKLDLGKKSNLLKVHFRWSNVIKPSGSMFVGTSPELEMALYTVCFFTRPDDRCPLSLGGKTFGIQTRRYHLRGNRGSVIGTAYPVF